MGSSKKRLKRAPESESESEMGSEEEDEFANEISGEEFEASDDDSDGVEIGEDDSDDSEEDNNGSEEEEEDDDDEDDDVPNGVPKDDEIEELDKEYRDLQNSEQSLMRNLKRHKDEDLIKGQAIKSQKALWDKVLELRFLIQKPYSKSNKLPQEPIRSLFCEVDEDVSAAYSDLISSSRTAVDSLVHLQEALIANNPLIAEAPEEGGFQSVESSEDAEEEEWTQLSRAQARIEPFRNKSIDKWQRKADVQSGAAAKKVKLLAFNQNISDQVATYMRDPSKMIRSMQTQRDIVGVFGNVSKQTSNVNEKGSTEGDPELLDDSEFYQQLLKEFFETIDPASSESAFYALKRLQTKKRKVVDRRASKSRKIRYHVHEKIVNFMAPQPMDLPPMAPKLFQNLFGLRTQKPTSAA